MGSMFERNKTRLIIAATLLIKYIPKSLCQPLFGVCTELGLAKKIPTMFLFKKLLRKNKERKNGLGNMTGTDWLLVVFYDISTI